MSKDCKKCKKQLPIEKFKSPSRKRCIPCNNKQYILNNKSRYMMIRAKETNLFGEYEFLKRMSEKFGYEDEVLTGRIKLYSAIIKMIEYDPNFADMNRPLDDEEKEYWRDIKDNIREAGKLIIPNINSDDYTLQKYLMYIPSELIKDVEYGWDGLVFENGVEFRV